METTRVKRIIFSLCLMAIAGLIFTGCSKDDPKPAARKISMKVTITVTGLAEGDQVDFGIGAGNHDASQYGAPVWKINGVTQGNEDHILLGVQEFRANQTYVLETVKPFDFGSLNASCINGLEANTITMSYKVEVDGKAETNVENLVIAGGQSHNKNYSYQAK
ncbi:hypothetical protein [Chitinophaga sp.]|uniref:hypothetical protein n=1 Tax=Chitinophaga sp. TaxID=1869181 RepID=UPI0031DAC156